MARLCAEVADQSVLVKSCWAAHSKNSEWKPTAAKIIATIILRICLFCAVLISYQLEHGFVFFRTPSA